MNFVWALLTVALSFVAGAAVIGVINERTEARLEQTYGALEQSQARSDGRFAIDVGLQIVSGVSAVVISAILGVW